MKLAKRILKSAKPKLKISTGKRKPRISIANRGKKRIRRY